VRGLAGIAEWVVVTPWRSIVVPEVGDVPGMMTDPRQPGTGVSACIGRPGCAKSRADVRGEARQLLATFPAGTRVHFSGCERRCGRPRGKFGDVVAEEAAAK